MLMETLSRWIGGVNDVLWTYVLVAALLGCAVWFTLRTRGVQFRLLGEMMRVLGESAGSGPKGERHVSSFQAFAVSLASRVGTGNLAGVATAIVVGGPGAVFWMWVIALLGAFREVVQAAGVEITFDLMDPLVFFGMLVGAAIPAVFSAMLIMGVNRNSQLMVKEIHRQFKEIPGLKEGTGKPDYARCIDISTLGAIRELVPAGLTAIAATLLVGFIGGVQAIGGYLTGNIISGLLLALLMSNAGGLWDNAKKYIESGHFGGKGSDAHKAAVIGDTVGDPFKDTAGPSINTQITVVSLVSSLAAVLFLTYSIF